MEIEQLKEQIKAVARARVVAKLAADAKTAARLLWESEHKDLIINAEETDRFRQLAEDNLRLMTLQVYVETGNKTPAPGVAIREVTKLEYDPQVAFLWAQDHRMALKLDTSAFEKIAKASPFNFVKMRGEAQATIASKLPIE